MNLTNPEPGFAGQELERKCESCQQPIAVPASAVHKRFCNTHCRNQWHKQQRSQGLLLLKQQLSKEQQQ